MITIQIPEVTIVDADDNPLPIDDSTAGSISQDLADGIVNALKSGVGYSIRESSLEVNVTTERTAITEKTETYIGR